MSGSLQEQFINLMKANDDRIKDLEDRLAQREKDIADLKASVQENDKTITNLTATVHYYERTCSKKSDREVLSLKPVPSPEEEDCEPPIRLPLEPSQVVAFHEFRMMCLMMNDDSYMEITDRLAIRLKDDKPMVMGVYDETFNLKPLTRDRFSLCNKMNLIIDPESSVYHRHQLRQVVSPRCIQPSSMKASESVKKDPVKKTGTTLRVLRRIAHAESYISMYKMSDGNYMMEYRRISVRKNGNDFTAIGYYDDGHLHQPMTKEMRMYCGEIGFNIDDSSEFVEM